MWQFRIAVCSGVMLLFLSACASSGNPGPEEAARAEFRRSLAERQVARRRETADFCLRRGVNLPEDYVRKGAGMLEEYVPRRFPCGISAEDRIARAEADFRVTWEAVMGTPVALNDEWLLAVKRRLATWVDAGFSSANIRFVPGGGNGFTIQYQSLVGGTFVSCGSSIELRQRP